MSLKINVFFTKEDAVKSFSTEIKLTFCSTFINAVYKNN